MTEPAKRAPMTQEEFVAVDGDHCPFCRSTDFGRVQGTGHEFCWDCTAEYRIEHEPVRITGYTIIRDPAGA